MQISGASLEERYQNRHSELNIPQTGFLLFPVRHDFREQVVEGWAVMRVLKVTQLVNDHIINAQPRGANQAQRFLRDHLPIASRVLPDQFEREDTPLYPMEALREALANALCHRDYGLRGSSIGIAIFDGRLEITNTGTLSAGALCASHAR